MGEVVVELRFRFSVATSPVLKPLGDVLVDGVKPSVVNCRNDTDVEVVSGCSVAAEVDVVGFSVVVGPAVLTVETVLVVVEGFAISTGFFGGDIITVALFITALTLDDTETSISS